LASANLVAYNAALKQTWTEDRLQEQLNQDDSLLTMVETTRRFHVGKEAVTPIHTGRSPGYTVLGAGGGSLNAAGNQASKQAKWNYTNHHFNIAVEGETIDGTSDDAIAVAQVIDTEVNFGLTDMRRQLVRQIARTATRTSRRWASRRRPRRSCWSRSAATTPSSAAGSSRAPRSTSARTRTRPSARRASRSRASGPGHGADVHARLGHHDGGDGLRLVEGLPRRRHDAGDERPRQHHLEDGDLGGSTRPWRRRGRRRPSTRTAAPSARSRSSSSTRRNRKVKQATGEGVDTVALYKQEEAFYNLLQAQAQYAGENGLDAGKTEKATFRGMSVQGYADIRNEDLFGFQKQHMFICQADKPYWQNKITGGEILAWIQGTDSYGAKCTYRIQFCNRRRDGTSSSATSRSSTL
jgi:hypothetical protein